MLILPSWLDAEPTFLSCFLLVYKLPSFSALRLLSSLTRERGSGECCPVSVLILGPGVGVGVVFVSLWLD